MTTRNAYHAIQDYPSTIRQLLTDAERAGCWETGIVGNGKRGTAINADVYGYIEDTPDGPLAVVQVRECQFRTGRYSKVRKDYYLLGRVETSAVFAHAIDSPLRSKLALSDERYCVEYALSKIWACKIDELKDIIRQGDIAFIPVRTLPESAKPTQEPTALLRDTHQITGDIYRTDDGTLFVKRGAKMTHTKGEHKTIKAKSGWYRVQPGYRAEVWGFSTPTID